MYLRMDRVGDEDMRPSIYENRESQHSCGGGEIARDDDENENQLSTREDIMIYAPLCPHVRARFAHDARLSSNGPNAAGNRIWLGTMRLGRAVFPAVATRSVLPNRLQLRERDANSWPSQIVCKNDNRRSWHALYPFITHESSKWCVKIEAIDEAGNVRVGALAVLSGYMAQQKVAFVIACDEYSALFLWAIPQRRGDESGNVICGVMGPRHQRMKGEESQSCKNQTCQDFSALDIASVINGSSQ